MMKKGISFLLTFSVLCSLLVPAALAYDGGGTEDLGPVILRRKGAGF